MIKRIASILLIVSMLCSLCACGKTPSASEMKLLKTEGTAHVSNEKHKEQKISENMNLYNGYGVGTETSSYAWINLDSVKVLKLNESTDASLEQAGRKLKVVLHSGDMFFCVLEKLGEDEMLTLETGNMSMAIRGTCGIVRVLSERESQLVLLAGEVSVTDTAGTVQQDVKTGQVLNLYVEDDGTANLTLREVRNEDVLDFAREYIDEDENILNKILSREESSGYGNKPFSITEIEPTELYREVIEGYRRALAGDSEESILQDLGIFVPTLSEQCLPSYRRQIYSFYDINQDGVPELLLGLNSSEAGPCIMDGWTIEALHNPIQVFTAHQVVNVAFDDSEVKKPILEITSNGYVTEWLSNHTWWCSRISFLFNTDTYIVAEVKFVGYDDSNPDTLPKKILRFIDCVNDEILLETTDEEEMYAFVDAFCEANYPIVPASSLTWYPIN